MTIAAVLRNKGSGVETITADARLSDAVPSMRKTETDIRVNRLSDAEVTLAEILRDRGYATGRRWRRLACSGAM